MISVIVSIYNGEHGLSKCIESLIMQTDQRFEILLIDDGSTDQSPMICDGFAEKYDNIRTLHKKNGGLSSARLAGFHEAKGNYLIFIDCDDFVHPELIERLYHIIQTSAPDMILYDYSLVCTNHDIIPMSIQLPDELIQEYNPIEFAIRSIAPGWNTSKEPYLSGFVWTRCIRRNVLSDEMFISERVCYTEDVLFNLAISRKICSISYIRKPLYYYCMKANSLTNRYRKNMWDMLLYRQNWITNYCRTYNLLAIAANRIERSWWSAIMISVDNACGIKDYHLAKKEIKRIVSYNNTQYWLFRVWKNIGSIPFEEKIKLFFLSLKMYHFYYIIKSQNKKN